MLEYAGVGYYLLGINIITLLAFALDKQRARRGHWRIPESRLLLLCLSGGSLGGWLAMYLFRHKTKHLKFSLGVPVITGVQVLLLLFLDGFMRG